MSIGITGALERRLSVEDAYILSMIEVVAQGRQNILYQNIQLTFQGTDSYFLLF